MTRVAGAAKDMAGRQVGFTVIEILVAAALGALVMLLLVGHLRSGRQAASASEGAAAAGSIIRLATELLREELRLAGSAPWPLPAPDATVVGLPSGVTAEQFLRQGLRLTLGAGGYSLRLTYIDDRLSGSLVARDLTFEAGADAQLQPQLYRRSGSSARQPLVGGVQRLAVRSGITEHGETLGVTSLSGHRVRALWLEFEAADEVAVVLLELPHRPVVVGP